MDESGLVNARIGAVVIDLEARQRLEHHARRMDEEATLLASCEL
jgi:hypothetical protein